MILLNFERAKLVIRLRSELDALLVEDASLTERCVVASDHLDTLRAERKAMPRGLRKSLDPQIEAAKEQVWKIGGWLIRNDSRIKATRAEIRRLERDHNPH
jgi:hypothetical protein